MLKEYLEKKFRTGGYSCISSPEFPCSVWIKRTGVLYGVCFFENTEMLVKDSLLADRIMAYVERSLRENYDMPCQVIALILSEEFSVSRSLSEGRYPRWFVDGEGKLIIFDGQPAGFGDLEKILNSRTTVRSRFQSVSLGKLPVVTPILVAVNVIIQIIVAFQEQMWGSYDLMNGMVLHIGQFQVMPEYWRLVTSVFLHFGWSHLLNNMLVLLCLGTMAERCVGKGRFLAVYLMSGIGANIVSVWWYIQRGQLLVATAGASGAIFGIAGLLLCIVLLSKGRVDGITLRQLVWMIVFTLYHGMAESGVNNCAHIAGGIIGFLCGAVIFLWIRSKAARK